MAASHNLSHLLATRRFLPIFIAQVLAAFNDSLFRTTLILLINYKLAAVTHQNPATLTALVSGIFILPFVLLSATGGELSDKFSKSGLIRVIKVAELCITILGTIGLINGHTAILFTTLFLMGIHSAIFGPVKYAILPELLDSEELLGGNSWVESSTFIAILLGSIAGSLGTGDFNLYLVPSIFLGCSLIAFVTGFMIPKTTAIATNLKISWNIIGKTYSIIRYSTLNKQIFISILVISSVWFTGIIVTTQLPVLLKGMFNVSPRIISFQLGIYSVGLALGSLFCNRICNGIAKFGYTPWAMIAMSLFMLDLCYAFHIGIPKPDNYSGQLDFAYILQFMNTWRIFFDTLMISICCGLYIVPFYLILQTQDKASYRSRVIASNSIMNALFMVIASVVTVILVKIGLSVLNIFVLTSIANLIFAAWVFQQLSKHFIKTLLVIRNP